jgi:hypothetical protein
MFVNACWGQQKMPQKFWSFLELKAKNGYIFLWSDFYAPIFVHQLF